MASIAWRWGRPRFPPHRVAPPFDDDSSPPNQALWSAAGDHAGQRVHSDAPRSPVHVPQGHDSHSTAPFSENVPGPHASHSVASAEIGASQT